jgi:hypothetical protein
MEISIKKIGNAKGTTGWLAENITNGTLKFIEGVTEVNKYHGLWLQDTKDFCQFLAAYEDGYRTNNYRSAEENDETRKGLWTDAAWSTLMDIAEQWCKDCNAALAAEEPMKIKIVRIEV